MDKTTVAWTQERVNRMDISPVLSITPKNSRNLATAMALTEHHFAAIKFAWDAGFVKVAKGARTLQGVKCTVDGVEQDAFCYRVGSEHAFVLPASMFTNDAIKVCLSDGSFWQVADNQIRPVEFAQVAKKQTPAPANAPKVAVPALPAPIIQAVRDNELVPATRHIARIYASV